MFLQLYIRNYVLIKELRLTPSAGLNIITGETGAGKSILLGAIGLLLGNRADTKVLFDESEKCIIEAEFDIQNLHLEELFDEFELDNAPTCLFRREISASGKSRAFINDTPVTLDALKSIGSLLIDVHSQHENLAFYKSDFQTSLLDGFAGQEALFDQYRATYKLWLKVRDERSKLEDRINKLAHESEFNTFQLNELLEANLSSGELAQLESEMKRADNAEVILSNLATVYALLSESEINAESILQEAQSNIRKISNLSPELKELEEKIITLISEVKEASRTALSESNKIDINPERATEIRYRLDVLNSLLKKHRVDTEEALIQKREELESLALSDASAEQELIELSKKDAELYKETTSLAAKLTAGRTAAVGHIKEHTKILLAELGMPEARLDVEIHAIQPGPSGSDQVLFLFSANKGIAPKDIRQVASGGEFSRLMFSIKYLLAQKRAMPTVIFDEIDTGISGEIALKLGIRMHQMSKNHQVLTITHLPQIASKGVQHYHVFKDNSGDKTHSYIKSLDPAERITEIARMIGGDNPSESAINSAKELLGSN